MFQAAATIGIATENGQEYCFQDNGFMGGFKNFRYCNTADILGKQTVDISEGGFGYKPIKLQEGKHYNLNGYFQSEKYFKHCEEKIRHTFEFRDNITEHANERLKALREKHSGKLLIGVHLRLGDYLTLKDHHTCLTDTNYYFNAINTFGTQECVFLVFSNDVALATAYFQKLNGMLQTLKYEIVQPGNGPQDMCMMSLCDGQIIANSSFSWWAAWLSKSRDKISPIKEQWFGPAYKDMDVKDIIPEGWRQIVG